MAENETKRVRRTPQQLAEAVDEQISKQETVIVGYEAKKQTAIAEYDQKIEAVRAKIKELEEKKKPSSLLSLPASPAELRSRSWRLS